MKEVLVTLGRRISQLQAFQQAYDQDKWWRIEFWWWRERNMWFTAKRRKMSEWIVIFLSQQKPNLLTINLSCCLMVFGSNSKKVVRLNPSHWINSKLILPRYFLSFLTSQLSRSLVNESHLAYGRKSQKYKIYQINVRRKPFSNIIAKTFSPTVIFFLTLENYSQDIS